MKAYKVFWKHKIDYEGRNCYSAIVVGRDIAHALAIAMAHGDVMSISHESDIAILALDSLVLVSHEKAAAAVGEVKK